MTYSPLALIAELTHRCPLHCVYCSNPQELQARASELSTAAWKKVFDEASEMGVLQLHLTGGEPTAREDIVELIRHGRERKLYTNLITSGVGLTEAKLKLYCDAGLDHIQLSFQDSVEKTANEFSGARSHAVKIKASALIKRFPLAFTMNIVVHRGNLDRLEEMIALGESLQADRLEIAHVQYYGWAFKNREFLLPTQEQVKKSVAVIQAAKERLKDKLRIDFVLPDYFAKFPKPCMGGWGQKSLLIDPAGRVLPCHSAMVIPGLEFENVKDQSLKAIWENSDAFERFRGEKWMKEPCRSCDRRTVDFGGCRCQAAMIAGDAQATDPVCSLSPARTIIDQQLSSAPSLEQPSWTYRK
jgi:pyrroloquinoline quinone biosynthesis protein E